VSGVFVSRPSALSRSQRSTFDRWCSALVERGLALRALSRSEYSPDPWRLLRERLGAVRGMVVFGFRQLHVVEGVLSPDTGEARPAPSALASPWTQIEAGLALSAGLPVLALAERGIADGVFDPTTWGTQVVGHELSDGPTAWVLDGFCTALHGRAVVRSHRHAARSARAPSPGR
jgi:hypothetical protein